MIVQNTHQLMVYASKCCGCTSCELFVELTLRKRRNHEETVPRFLQLCFSQYLNSRFCLCVLNVATPPILIAKYHCVYSFLFWIHCISTIHHNIHFLIVSLYFTPICLKYLKHFLIYEYSRT